MGCNYQADLHFDLKLIDPVRPGGLRQGPSSTSMPLARDQTVTLATENSGGRACAGPSDGPRECGTLPTSRADAGRCMRGAIPPVP